MSAICDITDFIKLYILSYTYNVMSRIFRPNTNVFVYTHTRIRTSLVVSTCFGNYCCLRG